MTAAFHIGFTGTRHGMTPAQIERVCGVVDYLYSTRGWLIGHHGDCVGADAEFHALMHVRAHRLAIHPGPIGAMSAGCVGDERHEPKSHLRRNADIVAAVSFMIAAPPTEEPQDRGGTWWTIKHAHKKRQPMVIVLPSGKATWSDGAEQFVAGTTPVVFEVTA